MTQEAILKQALTLGPDERVQLIDALLESVVDSEGCAELTSEQQNELLRRLEAHGADPNSAVSWEDAERQAAAPQ